MTTTVTRGVFRPKNKSFYRGKYGRFLMTFAGLPCEVVGTMTFPPEQCKGGVGFSVAKVVFPGRNMGKWKFFNVRPRDVEAE